MLTNTADGIVNWLKENKRGLTFQFLNRGTGSGNLRRITDKEYVTIRFKKEKIERICHEEDCD